MEFFYVIEMHKSYILTNSFFFFFFFLSARVNFTNLLALPGTKAATLVWNLITSSSLNSYYVGKQSKSIKS